jgi:probable rRNA maturation factor
LQPDVGKDGNVIIFKKKVAGLSESALRRFAARAAAAAGVRGEVNILVTSNRELKSLNRRFRGKDQPTDVLSFAAGSSPTERWAGDIAISAEMASANGNTLGHSAAAEVKILVLHGVLHLAGFDHERDNGVMARKEARLRRTLKLPVGLIARHNPRSSAPAKQPKRSRSGER